MKNTILVGDVGSTKSTWWFNSTTEHVLHLDGYNPVVHNQAAGHKLFDSLAAHVKGIPISAIWYYGAGVIDHHAMGEIKSQLSKQFPGSEIHVASDLIGAAIAACGYHAGTVGILGTGSHAAVWDGQKIVRQATSLGYILGDEGGGSDIGKWLLQAYFYNELPEFLKGEMASRLPLGRNGMFNELKSSTTPNQYLAEFARVAVLFQEHPWVKDLVSNRFTLFVKRHVAPISPEGPVHIIGSIGCIFAGLIKNALETSGLSAGNFIRDPAHRLFEIHLDHG